MTAICYYTCDLLPQAFLGRAGCAPRRLRPTGTLASRGDSTVHPTICPYVADLVAAGDSSLRTDETASLVVPGGCDAARRAGDLLESRFPDRVFTLLVPRSSGDDAVAALSRDLERLEHWLRSRAPEGPHGSGEAGHTHDALFELPDTPRAGGILVVGGPLSNAGLLESIAARGVPVSGVESCTSPERSRAFDASVNAGSPVIDVARAVLSGISCSRHESGLRRAHLTTRINETRPAAVLYARLPFCDPGAYDSLLVSKIAAERGLPFLEVEVGFPFELSGPLRVRLEAFLETLTLGGGAGADDLFDDELFDDELVEAALPESERR